ncbi:hypothetical protein KSS87_004383 [Heliosperma pusillum]|nr:hypothetical protein KSS87_004383 [Heliosperma pusillum]
MGIEGKRRGSEDDRVKKRKKVCYVCGHRGFSKLIVSCSECFDLAVHRYCLGVVPRSEDDTNAFYWVCESCPLMETSSSEIALVEDQPELLEKPLPKSFPGILGEGERSNQFQHSGETLIPTTDSYKEVILSPLMEHPDEIPRGLVLIVSSSGEITIRELLEKPLPKSFPGILEGEKSNQFQHSGETLIPMTDSYKEVILSPLMEHPEEIARGLVLIVSSSGEITIHESCKPEFYHIGESVYEDDENEQRFSIEDIIEHPEAISRGLVLIVNPSGEITTDESRKLDLFNADKLVYKDEVNGDGYSIEDTIELEFGAEEQIDSGFLSETVELDFGTDEENDVCYPEKPPTSLGFVVEDQVHQGIKASKVNVGIQPVSTDVQHELLLLPVPKHDVHPRLSENESQSSKPLDSPEMSIPASVLDMANELLETTLERIDVYVGPYKIRSDLAPILRNLLSKHGDIFQDCILEPDIFLVTVCQAIKYLHTIPFKCLRHQHIEYIRDTLKVLDAFAVNVEWLKKHCDYLQEVVHQTVKYLSLKKEWDETVKTVNLNMVCSRGSKQELRIMEDETVGKEGRLRKLEDDMKNIKSLWRSISCKSLVDGLF